jgi:chemosensory pili system protein ChpA (sensor histidine kinase/response regulator)
MADATILSWITAEVDQALEHVRNSIARFSASPHDPAALSICPEHLHQVSGALRMVGLSGATRFCEAIEGSFSGVNGSRPSSASIGIIDRAVLALKQFVDDVARGQANVPLRLFPVYRELAQLQGKADSSEKELFFPDLTPPAPSHPSPWTLAKSELAPFVQTQRARFQRGLLAWLRGRAAGLEDMRQALDALYQVSPQLPEPRALAWVAIGLIDGLLDAPQPEWQAGAKVLCNKIDFHMRDLAAGSQAVNDPLLREMLYLVARIEPSTQRLKDIKLLYRLDSLVPAPEVTGQTMELDMDWLRPALSDARSRLDALKAVWQQYVTGEPKSVLRFRELVSSFKAKSGELGNMHLIKLLDAIALVMTRLPDPYPPKSQFMVIEMASAFLLAQSVLENFTSPPADLQQQIGIMGGWLLDAAQGKSTGEPPAGLRADLSQQIGALQLRAQVAKEILVNLQYVEQVLDAYSRELAVPGALHGLEAYLRQIHGALAVLRFERATQVMAICESLIKACAARERDASLEDMDWIAEGLSSLGLFLAPCVNGRDPSEKAIRLFFSRYEKRAATAAAPEKPQGKPRETQQTAESEGLLDIFLEEASEVLSNIDAALPQSRERPGDRDLLTTIRRGFHTLKGSGRMVGLADLGEVAWEIEQVMNRWLERQQPACAELLELIALASAAFTDWIGKLRSRETFSLDGKTIVERAQKLRAAEPEPEEITVGTTRLARSFFDIYAEEALQHVQTLEAQCEQWCKHPGAGASDEFARAAHTLASSSRTAGFDAVADLAGELEHWTPVASHVSASRDVEPVKEAVGKLREMVAALSQRQAPAPAIEAARALRELSARLQAPPPVEVKPAEPAPVPAGAPAAAPAPAAPKSGKELRVMKDDIDPQLLPIFLEEAETLVPHIGSDLRDWKANPSDQNIFDSLRRGLHTLKGSARMAGAIRLGELTHIIESQIEAAIERGEFSAQLFDQIESKMDRLSLDLERMGGRLEAPAAVSPAPALAAEPRAARVEAPRAEPPLPSPAALLRVNADILDHLITESGEIAIARSRVEAELRQVKQSLSDLNDSVTRLRTQLREVEVQADSQMQSRLSVLEERDRDFDPLEFDRYTRLQELTRMMAESLNDAASIQQSLLKSLGETDAGLLQQSRISRDLQQGLMRMRAVPFSNLNERLYRIMRQTAREVGKKAELEIEGGQVELDRSVLEKIGAPLEHMLRNALGHGLESPQARLAAGKPESGRIAIALRQEGNEIALVVSDDGAGLDLDKLHKKAIEKGVLTRDQQASEAELMQLIFVSGLSTAEKLTQLSGRGVGMDVVRNEIASIGGRVEIATTRGRGTTFTVYLPLTLAVTQAIIVRAGTDVLAVSSAMVEQVLRVKADVLAPLYEKAVIESQDRAYPLYYLQHLLGARGATEIQTYNSVLLLRSGIQRIALHVDELLGNQEIVVKNIGPQLSRVPGVGGATVMADGRIVLIVNPVQLVQRAKSAVARTAIPAAAMAAPAAAATPLIIVVDDSLTVRKITSRLLEREGYRVLTAKDGVDALELIKDTLPAVMLVDIEMPRMDGFELTKTVRADQRTRGIPIIVISSRTAEKHRSQATQLGVNAFLGKPYQESELLEQVMKYLPA